ncbi:tRNA pseudouridine(55) synthase TruB [soil metagenome]
MAAQQKHIGFINVHKPTGITSHDVINKLRRLIGVKQVGHGGTLDPLAEGVLPVAVGAACRLLRFLPQDKTYVAEILLGQQTSTDDIEGDTIRSGQVSAISNQDIESALAQFNGEIDQVPPIYSAIHIDGKRAYELARAGNTAVEIKPRRITIFKLEILQIDLPIVKARIACSSGTYIRSIARDLGETLGCGGCLKSLVREQAGLFWLDKSLTLESIAERRNSIDTVITEPVSILSQTDHFNTLHVSDEVAKKFGMGQFVPVTNFESEQLDLSKQVLIVYQGQLLALCNISADKLLKPELVIADGQHKS